MTLHYSFAEVHFSHKTIRYLKAGKGTSYEQLIDIRRQIQQANPALIVVIMHGAYHISGGSTEENEDLLIEYFQSREFVNERLTWTKQTHFAGD